MSDGAHTHHAIDYVEFSVADLAAAKEFFSAAFGWAFNDYGPTYAGIQKAGGGESGGLCVDPDAKRGSGPLIVLFSTDLDASLSAVKDAGGEIVKEPFAFPGGRRFEFLDPSGNRLAVWAA